MKTVLEVYRLGEPGPIGRFVAEVDFDNGLIEAIQEPPEDTFIVLRAQQLYSIYQRARNAWLN